MRYAIVPLHPAAGDECGGRVDNLAKPIRGVRVEDQIGSAELIFDRDECNPARGGGSLATEYQPGHLCAAKVWMVPEPVEAKNPSGRKCGAEKRDRVSAKREPLGLVVGQHQLRLADRRQLGAEIVITFGLPEEGIIPLRGFLGQGIPECGAAVDVEREKGVGAAQADQLGPAEPGPGDKVFKRHITGPLSRPAAGRDDSFGNFWRKPGDGSQSESQRGAAFVRFEGTVPLAVVYIGRPHRDAMASGRADELRGGIKSHRLAVEQSGGEGGRVVVLQIG